jgi:putative mRNA 3-end processing factor
MRVRFLGACHQVGRSGLLVDTGSKLLLLDYGVLVDHEVGFPVHVSPRDIDAIILTHAHLDHSGLLPLFYLRGGIPLYGVQPTFGLVKILIRDFIKLSGYYLPYEYIDLETLLDYSIEMKYRAKFREGDAEITLLNAGHIPGSSQVLVESEGKRLLYTGDFNSIPTRLVPVADKDYKDLDAVVIESTYAQEDHPERREMERQFVEACQEVVADGGTVLVPAFGVGRSQEVLCILAAFNFKYPVYVDGMALEAIKVLQENPSGLRDAQLFNRAVGEANWIRTWHDRRAVIGKPGVIVSPAGMLKGGAALFYMESVSKSRRNAVFLVSYQVPGSPGRILLEQGKFIVGGKATLVKAKIAKFDFSSHSGKTQLENTLSQLDKRTKVFVVHGDAENCEWLSRWASRELGLESSAPKAGETVDL